MNILVLGGNGYLGSKVTRQFLETGHNIVCTKRKNSDLSRLKDIADKITWISASTDAIETIVNHIKFDWMINMVCNYGRDNESYDDVINSNMEYPLRVLNIALEKKIHNYLTIGTGLPEKKNIYSFSKKMFNEFGRFYADKYPINFYSLRLEMFYGSDEPANRFIPSLIMDMLLGKEVNTTKGVQHRDIIAVNDIIKAIEIVMNAAPKGYHEISVGTGIAPSISELIDYIWIETGRKSSVNKGVIPIEPGESDCIADTSFLKSIGIWEPLYWKKGIKQMIEEIRWALSAN